MSDQNLDRIIDILEKLKEIPRIKEEQKKLLEDIKKSLVSESQDIHENFENANRSVEETRKNLNSLLRISFSFVNVIRNVIRKFTNLKESLDQFSRSVARYSEKTQSLVESPFENFKSFTESLPIIGGFSIAFFKIYEMFDDLANAYSNAAKSGVIFSKTIEQIYADSRDLVMTLPEFANFLAKYANIVNRGNREFINYLDISMKTSDRLLSFGYDLETLRESAAQFLVIQRNLGFLRRINAEEQSKLFSTTIENFYSASKRLGIAATEILQSLEKLSEDPEARVALRKLGQRGQEILAVLEKEAPNLQKLLTQAIVRGGLERADDYALFATTEISPMIAEIYSMILSNRGSLNSLLDLIRSNSDVLSRNMQLFALMGQDHIVNILNELDIFSKKTLDTIESSEENMGEEFAKQVVLARNRVRATIADVSSEIIRRLSEIGNVSELISNYLIKITKITTDMAKSTLWLDLLEGFSQAATKLVSAIVNLSDKIAGIFGLNGTIYQAIVAGILLFLPKGLNRIFQSLGGAFLANYSSSFGSAILRPIMNLMNYILSSTKRTFLALVTGMFAASGLSNLFGNLFPEENSEQATETKSLSQNIPSTSTEPTTIPNISNPSVAGSPVTGAEIAKTPLITPSVTKTLESESSVNPEASLAKSMEELSNIMKQINSMHERIKEANERKLQLLQKMTKTQESVNESISNMISP
jgi:ABC-type transporter Mla subunit MlaD